MKKLFLSFGLVLGLTALALAQGNVNSVPQVGVTQGIIKSSTYSAASVGLATASSATDVFCISGSTTRTISVKRIGISGTAATLVTVPITIVRRVSLDTGGTASTNAALPVASKHLTSDGAATAVLTAYTANPTIVDASPLYFRSAVTSFNVTSALVASPVLEFRFGELTGWFTRGLDILKSTAQQVCVNFNATTVSTPLLNIDVTWTESP